MALTFISSPDIFNSDYADLSGGLAADIAAVFDPSYASNLVQAQGWTPGGPNSMTADLAQVWLTNLQAMAQTAGGDPQAMLVAGDLIGGRWPQNPDTLMAMFGDGSGDLGQALDAAADVYYSWYRELFRQAGLDTVLAAIGDHDIGDNNWTVGTARADFVDEMKEAFGRNMVDPLGMAATWNGLSTRAPEGAGQYDEGSYLRQEGNVLFLTVDVFEYAGGTALHESLGAVDTAVTGAHLDWVGDVLDAAEADASVDHVVVQGHVPVLTPVNAYRSSDITMTGGAGSEFWQLLQGYGTDNGGKLRVYLAGEVHATTTIQDAASGIVQISHGRIGDESPSWIAFDVTDTTITGIEYTIGNANTDFSRDIWQVDRPDGTRSNDAVTGPPVQTGDISIDIAAGQADITVSGTLAGWQGGAPRDLRVYVGSAGDDVFTGHNSGLTMHGLGGDDRLSGGAGNDRIVGHQGNDRLMGNGGNDRLFGNGGADRIGGNRGDDRAHGGNGNDRIWGGLGNDHLRGERGNDRLVGNDSDDRLFGGRGADHLDGGTGNDRLTGGAGADIFLFDQTSGSDTVLDFAAGLDQVDLTRLNISGPQTLAAAMSDVGADAVLDLTALGGNGTVTFTGAAGVLDVTDFLL